MTCCDFGGASSWPRFWKLSDEECFEVGRSSQPAPCTAGDTSAAAASAREQTNVCCQSAPAGSLAHAWHAAGCDCTLRHHTVVRPEIRWSGKLSISEDRIRKLRNPFCRLCWGPDPFSSLHLRNRSCLETLSVRGQEVVRWDSVGRDRSFIAAGSGHCKNLRCAYLAAGGYTGSPSRT